MGAYVLEEDYGYVVPKELAVVLSQSVQREAERTESEVPKADILAIFEREFVNREAPLRVIGYASSSAGKEERHEIRVTINGVERTLSASGSGPIDAFVTALKTQTKFDFSVEDYSEHALGKGADARAVCYVTIARGHERSYGVGTHASIVMASLSAVASALNRAGDTRALETALAAE